VNILALAKWISLKQPLIGIKMMYAGSKGKIVRGTCKPSKKAKDFYSQVTFNAFVNDSMLSYKLFHNGAFQLTGAHSVDDAITGINALLEQVKTIDGLYKIALKLTDNVLISHDDIVYNIKGDSIGYVCDDDDYYINNEHVGLADNKLTLQSKKWSHNKKNIYTLDGQYIGTTQMHFEKGITKSILRKSFAIQDDMIVYDGRVIGVLKTKWVHDDYEEMISLCIERRKKWLPDGTKTLISNVKVFPHGNGKTRVTSDDVRIFNVNVRFDVSRKIYRDVLWSHLVKRGYNVRFDSMTHVGVNFRYHYLNSIKESVDNRETQGKCVCEDRLNMRCNNCKIVSILCFSSGKVVVTGLKTMDEATIIAKFIASIYRELPVEDDNTILEPVL
jgi:TATA-box binding protein (TBP) (component of TFIID and TFIIIB)